jgi:regulator of protease activity HflC (stomatin/prohibitin superfamily)
VPDLAPDATHAAEDERDDKGAAGEAELDRLRQSGEGDGQRSERDAEGDADEERDKVRFVEFLERVADGGGCFV